MFLNRLRALVKIHANQGPRYERKYIIAKEQKRDERRASFQSSPKNKPHVHHKTHFHTLEVYYTLSASLTIKVLLIKILVFFDHCRIHLFLSNQCLEAHRMYFGPKFQILNPRKRFLL